MTNWLLPEKGERGEERCRGRSMCSWPMPWIWPETLAKRGGGARSVPCPADRRPAPPWWQARAGFLQWKALWLLAGAPLVWLNGCQLCQGDGRAGVSPLIETSPSSEPLTLGEQDLCQSTSNLLRNRWKQPRLRRSVRRDAAYNCEFLRSKAGIMFSPESRLLTLQQILWTCLQTKIDIITLHWASSVKLFGFDLFRKARNTFVSALLNADFSTLKVMSEGIKVSRL